MTGSASPSATDGQPAGAHEEERSSDRSSFVGDAPRLADGVRLVGEFRGSGYRQDRYLAQAPDGSLVQLTPELYAIAEASDGERSYDDIAAHVQDTTGTDLTADDVWVLAAAELRKTGVLTHADGSQPQSDRVDPLLALRVRQGVVPPRAVHAVGRVLAPLCGRVPVALGLIAYVSSVVWVLRTAMAGAMDVLSASPAAFLLALGAVFVSAAWHELGHAAACVRAGGRPGEIGAGFYLLWPAFYTDVTDAYRLPRRSRLAVDLGGLYFSALFSVAVAVAFAVTQQPLLPVLLLLVQIQMAQQLLPFVRFDGYYVLSDLTGVPDLFLRLGSTVKSLLPWKETPEEARELRRGVRITVAVWVVLTIVLLGSLLSYTLWQLPQIVLSAIEVGREQGARALEAAQQGDAVSAVAAGLRALIPAIVPLVLVYVLVRLGARLGSAVLRRVRGGDASDEAENAAPASGPAEQAETPAVSRSDAPRYWWDLAGTARTPADLPPDQERALRGRATDPDASAGKRRRARIVLAATRGWSDGAIAQAAGASRSTVGRWRRRFDERGMTGLGLQPDDDPESGEQRRG